MSNNKGKLVSKGRLTVRRIKFKSKRFLDLGNSAFQKIESLFAFRNSVIYHNFIKLSEFIFLLFSFLCIYFLLLNLTSFFSVLYLVIWPMIIKQNETELFLSIIYLFHLVALFSTSRSFYLYLDILSCLPSGYDPAGRR